MVRVNARALVEARGLLVLPSSIGSIGEIGSNISDNSGEALMKSIVVIVALGLIGPAGCASSGPGEDQVIVGYAEPAFLSETLVDWVSYATQVSEVTVVSEEQLPIDSETLAHGGGYVGRRAVLHIDRNLWTNSDGFEIAKGDNSVLVVGWVYHKRKLIRFAVTDSPRLEVGGRYILPLTQRPFGEAQKIGLGQLGPEAVLASPGDRIAMEDVAARGNYGAAAEYSNRPVQELQEALEQTPMEFFAAKHRDLPPYERIEAVMRDNPGGFGGTPK